MPLVVGRVYDAPPTWRTARPLAGTTRTSWSVSAEMSTRMVPAEGAQRRARVVEGEDLPEVSPCAAAPWAPYCDMPWPWPNPWPVSRSTPSEGTV